MSRPNKEFSASSSTTASNGFQLYAKSLCDAGSSFLGALLAIPPEASVRAASASAPVNAAGAGEHEVSLLRLYYMARGKDSLTNHLADELHEVAVHGAH